MEPGNQMQMSTASQKGPSLDLQIDPLIGPTNRRSKRPTLKPQLRPCLSGQGWFTLTTANINVVPYTLSSARRAHLDVLLLERHPVTVFPSLDFNSRPRI